MDAVDRIDDIMDEYAEKTAIVVRKSRMLGLGIFYIILLIAVLMLTEWLFRTHELLFPYQQYLPFIYAAEVLGLGALAVESLGRGAADVRSVVGGPGFGHALKAMVRVAGYGVLLSIMASIFNADPAAALTIGGFLGLVAGLAVQHVLGNAVAGVFLILSRPFRLGERVKLLGKYEGMVKDIGVMYTVLESKGDLIYIPSNKIVGDIIVKRKR